jgi:hypothetical protein
MKFTSKLDALKARYSFLHELIGDLDVRDANVQRIDEKLLNQTSRRRGDTRADFAHVYSIHDKEGRLLRKVGYTRRQYMLFFSTVEINSRETVWDAILTCNPQDVHYVIELRPSDYNPVFGDGSFYHLTLHKLPKNVSFKEYEARIRADARRAVDSEEVSANAIS